MSQVVAVQNALNALVASTLPEYDHLSDSLDSADNTMLTLDKGFASSLGDAKNINSDYCNQGQTMIERAFPVILSNVYAASFDASGRILLEQSLYNDHAQVVAAIKNNITLSGTCVDARFDGDSGLEYLEGENKKFIVIISNVIIKYIEGV